MNILYEDEHIVVCEKEAGISSEITPDGNDVPTLLKSGGINEIYTVHRLDTATTGIMVYAKTKQAAAFLSREISENRFNKEYTAVVRGTPGENEGVFEDLLFKDSKKNKSFVVKRERRGVKKAKLSYKVLENRETPKGTYSLVRIKLYTGRTHQIRVQFSSRGMPLAGDGKYGAKDNAENLGLQCVYLSFRHPVSLKTLCFELPSALTFPG